jgi:type IV pilus assembly protein PilO
MANLQEGADRHAAQVQQRLLLGLPIGVGALLGVVLVGVGVIPQWLKLQSDSERLAQLEEIQGRIPLLRAQIAKTAESQEAAERKQQKVLQLIEGSGELVTFLAQLDREAARFGVQLDLYEPVAALPPPAADDKKAQNGDQPGAPPKSPLEAAGLKAQQVLLTARGSYPNVLAFLRATEKLTVLVSQSNLSLTGVEPPKAAPQQTSQPTPQAGNQDANQAATAAPVVAPVATKTELKLMLTYYQSGDAVKPIPVPPKNQT